MSEVYPSDSELNALLSDSETGVEYIPTGTAPYYLHFRKLLYRLLLATKRANDLRVYDAGGLSIGVKPGKFWNGYSLVEFGGASVLLADDKPGIYVYLDSSGVVHYSDYVQFPEQLDPHVRLAVVTTGNGDITNIQDCRDQHSIAMPTDKTDVVEAHTSDDTLTHIESGSVHTNLGAAGVVTLSLPAVVNAGTKFTFSVQTAQELRIDPVANAIIDESGSTADKYKSCSTVGAFLSLISDANGNWIVTGKSGTWAEEV